MIREGACGLREQSKSCAGALLVFSVNQGISASFLSSIFLTAKFFPDLFLFLSILSPTPSFWGNPWILPGLDPGSLWNLGYNIQCLLREGRWRTSESSSRMRLSCISWPSRGQSAFLFPTFSWNLLVRDQLLPNGGTRESVVKSKVKSWPSSKARYSQFWLGQMDGWGTDPCERPAPDFAACVFQILLTLFWNVQGLCCGCLWPPSWNQCCNPGFGWGVLLLSRVNSSFYG